MPISAMCSKLQVAPALPKKGLDGGDRVGSEGHGLLELLEGLSLLVLLLEGVTQQPQRSNSAARLG